MSSDVLLEERIGTTRLLRLNRPGNRNALNRELLRAIHDSAVDAGADPGVRAIVITGK